MDVQLGISKRSAFFSRIEQSAWSGPGRAAEGGGPRGGAAAGFREPAHQPGGPQASSLRLLSSPHMLPKSKQEFSLSNWGLGERNAGGGSRARWGGSDRPGLHSWVN